MRKFSVFTAVFALSIAFCNAQRVTNTLPHSDFFRCDSLLSIGSSMISAPSISKNTTAPAGRFPFAKILPMDSNFMDSALVSHTPSGTIYIRCVESPGAYSLGFRFSGFCLADGAELHIYSADRNTVLGAITSANNADSKILRTAQIPGSRVFLELFVPNGVQQAPFTIQSVYYDYVDVLGLDDAANSPLSKRAACSSNEDLSCPNGDDYQDVKHAILRYSYDDEGTSCMCTGVLVNNINNNEIPFVLTAAHCVCTDETASSTIFYVNYERPICGTSGHAQYQTVEGAKLVATAPRQSVTTKFGSPSSKQYPTLDFSLLKLNVNLNESYQPYYAGISINEDLQKGRYVTIHHPQGSVKKISVAQYVPYQDSYPNNEDDTYYLPFSHWHERKWSAGTTEPGSSGAPLLDPDHNVIGTLSGGYANCSEPINDFFQMISKAWDSYPEPEHQLKHWLADGRDVTEIQPYDPYNVESLYPRPILEGSVNADSSRITLTWHTDFPDDGENPKIVGYRIFCNQYVTATITDPETTQYVFKIEKNHTYSYCIANLYEDNVISPTSNYYQYVYLQTPTGDIAPSSQKMQIFPNPASDYFVLQVPMAISNASLIIVDSAGNTVSRRYVGNLNPDSPLHCPIEGLRSGIYVVYAGNASHQFALKLIVL
ncbi:MAG: trypsin-like peptidase domain-containing protein [Bacteroidales bacterium]|nr:trypsin-like peptidase domain-containing protein [Bacteroidales bacterium]